jgi:hypothetical protein
MITTYASRNAAFLVLGILALSSAQSLEERVQMARRLQAQTATEADSRTLDSLIRERRKAANERQGLRSPLGPGIEQSDFGMSDSLLAGPTDTGMQYLAAGDTLVLRDSLGLRRRIPAKPVPKRYEQRIFAKVDRSAFSAARGAAGRDHVLGAGDQIIVSLWGDREREYDLTLNAEGKVFLEGVGLVPLAGRNLNEAQAALKERMARIYSGINRGTAHVDVSLAKAGPIKVFVLGEVKLPGGFVFTGNTSVL